MVTIIESGVKDANRLAVFNNRMREYETLQSATNHISTAQLNGQTGVFTIKNNALLTGIFSTLLSITNNDPVNLMIIDRIYIQAISCTSSLPNPNVTVFLGNGTGSTNLTNIIRNENRFSNIKPLITAFGNINSTNTNTIYRAYPIIGDVLDMVPQASNGFILSGGPVPGSLALDKNTIGVFVSLLDSSQVNIQSFIRFMMVPPGELG